MCIFHLLPIPRLANSENIVPITTFRIYENDVSWALELSGKATHEQIHHTNVLNYELYEIFGENREEGSFRDSKRPCLVDAVDSEQRIPIYAGKFFSISPYTEVEHLDHIVQAFERALGKITRLDIASVY